MDEIARLVGQRVPDAGLLEDKRNKIDYENPLWSVLAGVGTLAVLALVNMAGVHFEDIFSIAMAVGVALFLLIGRPISKTFNPRWKRFETVMGWILILSAVLMLVEMLMFD